MKAILEWLRPGAKVKRFVFLQLISVGVLIYSIITLITREIITPKILIAYIALITISLFLTIYSFLLAQRNILRISLKNISSKENNIDIKRLLYTDHMLKKAPKIVILGGGKGLANILAGLKEYTSNITSIVSTFDDGGSTGKLIKELDILPPGDIRRSIVALSSSDETMDKLLSYRFPDGKLNEHSLGNLIIAGMTEIMGGFAPAIKKLSKIFNVRGNILPVTLDRAKLCAGLESGEIVVGEANIRPRVIESKQRIKQIFLKDVSANPTPGVIEAIKEADVIVIGPGSLYTSVLCNLLVNEIGKAIIQSKAKKVMIANLMNEPGETLGYTLAKHVNEMERYIGKHILDYCIANSGDITEEMIKDFNQGLSTPLTLDLENIQNRTISVIKEDLVITAPNNILHDNIRVAEIIMNIAKSKKTGSLNLLKYRNRYKNKHKKLEKELNKNKDNKKIEYKLKKVLNKTKDISKNIINKILKKTNKKTKDI